MNRKNMPLILMLTAGAVTCVITFIQNYSILGKLVSLLFVLVLFYFLGSVLKWTLDYFERQNQEETEEEEAGEGEEEATEAQSEEGE
nr:hypothetical protein [uncultured Acetatifactor sp.]